MPLTFRRDGKYGADLFKTTEYWHKLPADKGPGYYHAAVDITIAAHIQGNLRNR